MEQEVTCGWNRASDVNGAKIVWEATKMFLNLTLLVKRA